MTDKSRCENLQRAHWALGADSYRKSAVLVPLSIRSVQCIVAAPVASLRSRCLSVFVHLTAIDPPLPMNLQKKKIEGPRRASRQGFGLGELNRKHQQGERRARDRGNEWESNRS